MTPTHSTGSRGASGGATCARRTVRTRAVGAGAFPGRAGAGPKAQGAALVRPWVRCVHKECRLPGRRLRRRARRCGHRNISRAWSGCVWLGAILSAQASMSGEIISTLDDHDAVLDDCYGEVSVGEHHDGNCWWWGGLLDCVRKRKGLVERVTLKTALIYAKRSLRRVAREYERCELYSSSITSVYMAHSGIRVALSKYCSERTGSLNAREMRNK